MSNTAIALFAAAQSNLAAAEAARANAAACRALMPGFTDATATVEAKRDYAECVATLHPSAMSADGVLAAKVLIAAAFIGAALGVVKVLRDPYDRRYFTSYVLFSLLGACALPVAIAVFALAVAGVRFLFS